MSELFLLRESLRAALSPKRLLIALLLVALPAIIGLSTRMVLGADRFDQAEVYTKLSLEMVFRLILILLAVLYGTGALSQEIEGRTIVYLLTRPMPRWRILLTKIFAAWLLICVASALSALLLALALFGSKLGQAPLWADLRAILIGAGAYAALFCFLSTVLARPLLYALLYGIGWENIASIFPGGFARLSILSNLKVLATHLQEEASGTAEGPSLGAFLNSDPTIITVPQAWTALWLAVFGWLILSILVFSRGEYAPREEAG